ncbi:MAG TPA: DEAD/DEAH box helicase, partial [Enhygromyxa sp.]|nr:DEAD/DEAH box helicase [Enhygromyxa sp.]
NIKNLGAKVTQAAKALRSTHRVALSGTPVENHLGDLYSILDFIQPGVLGSPDEFRELYRRPIERHDDAARMKSLSDRVAPLILRRTKAQVLSELPSKTEIIVYADLAGRQRDLYETVRLSMEERVRSALQNRGFAKSQIVFLDALLKLRQVCCDPRLVKLPQASRVTQSAKLEELLLLLEQLLDAGRRVVLFSQFTSMLAIIARRLDEARVTHLQLTGRTRDRAAVVEAFSRGEASVFLVSLKAGGSGLNLTHADTVIHYDPWWNPAVEDQASDRVHRLGQTENVTVFKLVCRGSVEERILALHAHKRRLARGAQGGATEHGGRFDLETFEALLRPLDE